MQSIDKIKLTAIIYLLYLVLPGLKNGDDVKISGINVGKITKLDLDLADYNAKIYIKLNNK